MDSSYRNFCKSDAFNEYKLKQFANGIEVPRNAIEDEFKENMLAALLYMTANAPVRYRSDWKKLLLRFQTDAPA